MKLWEGNIVTCACLSFVQEGWFGPYHTWVPPGRAAPHPHLQDPLGPLLVTSCDQDQRLFKFVHLRTPPSPMLTSGGWLLKHILEYFFIFW